MEKVTETTVELNPSENGHYVDLQSLHADLNLLGNQGLRRVIIYIDKSCSMGPEYSLVALGYRPDAPSLKSQLEHENETIGKRICGDAGLGLDRTVSHHSWVSESDFIEWGAKARIVVDPEEVTNMSFSWDTHNSGRDEAIDGMEFAKHLLLIY